MSAATRANDRAAWDAAKREADAGVRDLRAYVKPALAAANGATDAQVRERLATIEEILKEAENATNAASERAPTPRAPELSIADDLLAALPPDHPVFPAEEFYKTAKLAVEWVFRERASSSDIAAFKELVTGHRDHEIARRFRRFGPPKQEALLAVLEKNEVKLAARDREQQRRREAEATAQRAPVDETSSDAVHRDAGELAAENAAPKPAPAAAVERERHASEDASEQLASDDVALVQRKARGAETAEHASPGDLAHSELAETVARDAVPIARELGLNTFNPAQQITINEDGAPAGRADARGAAHGDAIHLDSRRAGADTREVIAHELVHLAQAELPASQDQGRVAAEHEAAELAAEIAGGASPRPPAAAISLTAAAADSDALRAPRGDAVPGGLGPRWAAAADARYLGDGRFELTRSKRHVEVRRTDRATRVELRGEGYVIELPRRLVGVELEQRFVAECARLDAQTGAATAQLDEEALARRKQLIGALALVTPRWQQLGGALFTPADEPAAPHPPEVFTAQAYGLLLDTTADVAPVELVLAGPGREPYARAFAQAAQLAERDRPRLAQIRTDIAYLATGGELEFAATRLVSSQALLSPLGKDALRSRGELAKDPIVTYAHTDAVAHGVKIRCSRLVAEGVDFVSAAALAAHGGPERSRAVIALGNMLIVGAAAPTPAAMPVPSADPAAVTAEAAALTKLVQDAIAQASANHKLAPDVFQRLDTALGAASPRARELVWANHDVTAALARALDPSQSKALLGKLDPVEALYQTVKPSEWQTVIKLRFAPQQPPARLLADNPAYPALRAWLEAHPGEPNRALRARVLEHAQMKRDVIDRLPADQQPIIYRLITSGNAAPTAEDQIHEAAERGRGADVVRALRALASTAPARLAELERDAVFRRAIEGLRDVVDVDGVPLRPYDVCLTLWGRNPRENADPQGGAPREINTTGDDRPLTADERLQLDTELFDPALADIHAQVANTAPRPPGSFPAWNAGHRLPRAQAILDRLRVFERQAAQPAYKTLLQRERLVAGAELGQRFGRRWNIDLRTWAYESGGPNIRSGVARILGNELGAAVGTFNGEQVSAGDALPEKMTLQQALRETTAGAEGWTISEWCSVESRALSRAIDDGDMAAVLTSWERFAGAIGAAAPELARLTGRTLRPIDLLRNALMEHGGHLETRIAERFAAAERDELCDRLGIAAAAREDAAHAPAPDVAQQAETAYRAPATQLWSCLAALGPRSALSEYAALGRLLTLVRNLPRLDATPADPHAVEEQPPRSFAAYYRARYGASIDGHAEAVLRAMPERERAVPLADACRELELDPERLGAVFQQPTTEALAIDAHNQHLVRAEFTVDDAKGRARQIWQVLHGSGRLETIHTQLYGDCNDEEQRLIRIAFRQLSGGFDLAFYLRQAIDAQQRRASEHADDPELAKAAAAIANQDQQVAIGATGSRAGAQAIIAGGGGGAIHVHGTETELARGLAVAESGQIDIKTSLDAAARREDADQVFRTLDEATSADKRAILADGPLVNRLRSLGQWQWERCFKVLSNQADLADRLYSRSHGDGGFLEGAFGGTHEAGIKEDLKGNGRRLRLKYDAEVRAEIARLPEPPVPQAIDREIHRRVLDAAGFDAADPSVDAILQSELSGDELAEMQAMVRNAGTARDWAVACGGDATAIRAEIRALSPAERAAKLRDPRYLQLLGERLTDPEEHRAALNALRATDDADITYEGGALARLDAAVRAADARRTLRALSELTPDEHARVRSDAQLTTQIMAALPGRELQVARELLGFEVLAADGAPATTETSGAPATDAPDPDVGAETSASGAVRQRAALFVHQSAGRLRVACLGSWRDVLMQATEIYKLDFALGFTQHGEGGHAQAADAMRPALDTAALRAQIWTRASAVVRAFAAEHQADPGKKTRDAVTAPQMIEIVQAAVLAQRDPSDALIAENIFTADEKISAAPDPMAAAVLKARELDASTDATGLAATLRAASDQHVIEHWTSIKQLPAGQDGDTLQHRYRELVITEGVAAAQRKAQQTPQTAHPPASASDVEPTTSPTAATAPAVTTTGSRVDDPTERAAVQAQRRFLEYQIKIAQALEAMLLPYMGDDRAATQARAGGEQQIAGRDNKRYNDLAQIIYQRIPQLPAERIGQAIGVRPEHQWLLASEARRHAGEVYLRDQRHLRHHGEQNSAGSVAQDEKELVHEEQTRLGRHHAQAIVDGEVTRTEGAEYDRRYAAGDRAQEAHQAAKEAAAAWASLIVGVVVTLAATVLTGGLATGPVAMMALAGATAALSATAKSLVMERVLEGEWDREDAARMISTEVITGIVTMGTTYYAQRLLAAAGAATSLAKQGAAVRQVLRRPPRLFQSIAHEGAEEVISEGMSGVVEAGLAATDPAHWMHGYEEGARSAKEAALARLAQVDNQALQGGVTAVLTSVGARVLHRTRRGGGHVDAGSVRDRSLDVPAKQKKRVDVARNLKQTLGDPGEKFMEALIQWGMQQDGPINWSAAPSDLLRGWIEEMGEGAVEVHTGTVHRAKRDAFAKAEIAKAKDRVPAHELADYQQMQDGALDTDVLVSIGEYQRIREYVILRGLAASESRGGFTLTPIQRRAFIDWVRAHTPQPDQLASTAAIDPRTIPEVMGKAPAATSAGGVRANTSAPSPSTNANPHSDPSARTDTSTRSDANARTDTSTATTPAPREQHAKAEDLAGLHDAWRRTPGATVSELHYDPATNTSYFDVASGQGHHRVSATLAPRVHTAPELLLDKNRIIGHPIAYADGHAIMRALVCGDLQALNRIGVNPWDIKLPPDTEFGLGELTDGRVVLIRGEAKAVDWSALPGITPIGHTHPNIEENDLDKAEPGRPEATLGEMAQATSGQLFSRVLTFPSPQDFMVMGYHQIAKHRVYTPFVVHSGVVTKPEPGDTSPRLEFDILDTRQVGIDREGRVVFHALVEGIVADKRVLRRDIWIVQDKEGTGGKLEMARPPGLDAPAAAPAARSLWDRVRLTWRKWQLTNAAHERVPVGRGRARYDVRVLTIEEFKTQFRSESARAQFQLEPPDDRQVIYVREDATLDDVKAETQHIKQMAEPKTAAEIRRHHAEDFAKNWDRLSAADRLEHLRRKLELELDAYRTLHHEGDASAAETLANLEQLRDEVDALFADEQQLAEMNARLVPMPAYLEDPAYLFVKYKVVNTADGSQRPDRNVVVDPTSMVEQSHTGTERSSAFMQDGKRRPDVVAVRQIGVEWTETVHTSTGYNGTVSIEHSPEGITKGVTVIVTNDSGKRHAYALEPGATLHVVSGERVAAGHLLAIEPSRRYRLVEVERTDGSRERREEIRSKADGWGKRGNEATRAGALLEAAARLQVDSQLAAKRAAAEHNQEYFDSVRLPHHRGGGGFDDVLVEFTGSAAKPEAKIRIREVKNYPNDYVPLQEFTAIRGTDLQDNMNVLESSILRAIEAHDKGTPLAGFETLSAEQLEAVRAALNKKRIEFEIVLGPETNMGPEKRSHSVLSKLRKDIEAGVGKDVLKITGGAHVPEHVDQSWVDQASQPKQATP